jgi:phosphoglycolate phosphatase-like HAD superfamily hydrolase
MDILLFDMDGVLVKPMGYHRALQEVVRLAGIKTGFGEVLLTDEQIARFEALGISSEWHSSALCFAAMVIAQHGGMVIGDNHSSPMILTLEELFVEIAAQPLQNSALHRAQAAVENLTAKYGVPTDRVRDLVVESESIQSSLTLNWFQELILGSENYTNIYQRKPQFRTDSYLSLYDETKLEKSKADKVLRWAEGSDHGAAIMTNRPSRGPSDFSGMPDAEMGSRLVGLANIPVVGKGEILWLAANTDHRVENISKPVWMHAMAAILVASGWSAEKSLKFVGEQPEEWDTSVLNYLNNGRITVFEDTPSGLVSTHRACELLNDLNLGVEVRKIGVADELSKQATLSAQFATVYPDINQALASLDDF